MKIFRVIDSIFIDLLQLDLFMRPSSLIPGLHFFYSKYHYCLGKCRLLKHLSIQMLLLPDQERVNRIGREVDSASSATVSLA